MTKPQDIPPRTLGGILDETAARFPEREALVFPDRGLRLTWSELGAKADRLARGLFAAGMGKGEKIALLAANVPLWPVVQFAAAKIGAILLPINPNSGKLELAYILEHSGCENLFLTPSFRGRDLAATLYELLPELKISRKDSLRLPSQPKLKRICALEEGAPAGMFGIDEFFALAPLADESGYRARLASVAPGEPVSMHYTSGTTGRPKGVLLSHAGVGINGYWGCENLGLAEDDRLCSPLPLFHSFGCVYGPVGCASHGTCLVVMETFDAGRTLAAVEREKCTALYGVPTMFLAELEHPDFDKYDLSSLRTGVIGGSVCPESLARAVREKMGVPEMTIAYGLTEASPVVAHSRATDPPGLRCVCAGSAMPGVEIKIADPKSGAVLPPGEAGEILCRGYNVMLGYYKMPHETALAIDAEGWLRTGDLGILDEEGRLRITGRIKDIIIRGGENIDPCEIEEFLHGLPGIAGAQVVGAPSRKYGEEAAAFLVVRPGHEYDARKIAELCRGKIARHKIPALVATLDEFPLNPTGKILKSALRELAAKLWPDR